MKKRILVILLISALLLIFTGCGHLPAPAVSDGGTPSAGEASAPAPTAAQTAEQTAAPTPAGEAAAEGELKFQGVEFDRASDDYFGGDAAAALQKLSPLLLSAARAEFCLYQPLLPVEKPDTSVEWAVIYQYLNSYGDENAESETLEDGRLAVSREEMSRLFHSLFSFSTGSVPPLDTDFDIEFDESAQLYTIGRSDFGEVSFALTGFSMSKADGASGVISATVFLTGMGIDGEAFGTVLVEIVPKADTLYGYSIQSAEMQ